MCNLAHGVWSGGLRRHNRGCSVPESYGQQTQHAKISKVEEAARHSAPCRYMQDMGLRCRPEVHTVRAWACLRWHRAAETSRTLLRRTYGVAVRRGEQVLALLCGARVGGSRQDQTRRVRGIDRHVWARRRVGARE